MVLTAERTALEDRSALQVGAALTVGTLALATRPVGYLGMAVTLGVGCLGLILTDGNTRLRPAVAARSTWLVVVAVGVLTFISATPIATVPADTFRVSAALAGIGAAVAEEAFFRRLAYGWLSGWGPAFAVVLTGVLFALVHLPLYGTHAFAVDLGAGILLGWQRWASGGWSAPAVTHAAANLMQMIRL